MLQEVTPGPRVLSDYTHIVGKPLVEEINELAEKVKGKRVLHLSATAFGGGVSEIMYTLIPLMNDVGLDAHWQIILGRDEFFDVTKLLHNSLQGDEATPTEEQWATFDRFNLLNAMGLQGDWDVIVVHDPQPVMVREDAQERAKAWVWRCHIDLSTPNPQTIERLSPSIEGYDASIWHVDDYVPDALKSDKVRIFPPAIDPLAPKNMAMSRHDAEFVSQQFGIDPERPLLLQVSRFDPWKDPMGVIDCYRQVKEQVPEIQLALVGSMASDDPEGWDFYNATVAHASDDPDIHILNNFHNVGGIEVNAFQSLADICMQKSTKEGFGLTVTEALWKARPTIGGNVGGIPLQITDGETGFLVDSPEQAAQRSIELLKDPELGERLGRAGKEHARTHFLTPRLLRDYLKLFSELDL